MYNKYLGLEGVGKFGGNICVIRWPQLHYNFILIVKTVHTHYVLFIKDWMHRRLRVQWW